LGLTVVEVGSSFFPVRLKTIVHSFETRPGSAGRPGLGTEPGLKKIGKVKTRDDLVTR
jgi:hypothetical protein